MYAQQCQPSGYTTSQTNPVVNILNKISLHPTLNFLSRPCSWSSLNTVLAFRLLRGRPDRSVRKGGANIIGLCPSVSGGFEVLVSGGNVEYGRVPNLNQSEAIEHCFLVSDWFNFGTFLQKSKNTVLCCLHLLFYDQR